MSKFLTDFRNFINRGNLLDMAVGLTVGVAFAAIAKALVSDIIMPAVGMAVNGVNFKNLMWVIKVGKTPGPYPTIADAQKAGAVTINYGDFVNTVITFIIIAIAVFLVVRTVNNMQERRKKKEAPAAPTTKDCPHCCTAIPIAAKRCPNCTSELEAAV